MTLEEKAQAHVDKIFLSIIDKHDSAPWPEFRDALAQIYIAGAEEALVRQWRSVEAELPEIDEEVLVEYSHVLAPTHKEKDLAYYDGEDWYLCSSGAHVRPTFWMPIPEITKNYR